MNVDAIVLSLVAIADLGLLVNLRRRRRRRAEEERVARSLVLAVRNESAWTKVSASAAE
jgi:hypothetical protein